MAVRQVNTLPHDDGRDLYIGRHSTSLGQELPATREGYISQNAQYDRRAAEDQKRHGSDDLALHPVYDATDLDMLPNEIAFVRTERSRNPYSSANAQMTAMTSLNGLTFGEEGRPSSDAVRAAMIEDRIVPVGVADDRIPFQTDGEFQLPRNPVAIQVSGKTTLRTQKEIGVGQFVCAKVPTKQEVRERRSSNRVGGRPASKVVLELAPIADGGSFAARTRNAILERNSPNVPAVPNKTPTERAYKNIEDAAIYSAMGRLFLRGIVPGGGIADPGAMENSVRDMAGRVNGLINPDPQSPEALNERQTLLRVLFGGDDPRIERPNQPDAAAFFDKAINAQQKAFAAYADLLRIEGNFFMGRCTHYKKGVVDVLM